MKSKIYDKLLNNRSHRSFTADNVTAEDMREMIEAARVASCGMNRQAIRYCTITDPKVCDEVFTYCKFAGALSWNPELSESPRGYIVLCLKGGLTDGEKPSLYIDLGLAASNITLTASELGYGACMLSAYDHAKLDTLLDIVPEYQSHLLIALGKPTDEVSVTDVKDGVLKYSRDGYHHYVPKLSVDELVIKKL